MGAQTVTNNVEVFSLDVLPVRMMLDVRYCYRFIFSLNTELCHTSAYKLSHVYGVPGGPVVDEVVPVAPLLSNGNARTAQTFHITYPGERGKVRPVDKNHADCLGILLHPS